MGKLNQKINPLAIHPDEKGMTEIAEIKGKVTRN